jgi:hypothetical protein
MPCLILYRCVKAVFFAAFSGILLAGGLIAATAGLAAADGNENFQFNPGNQGPVATAHISEGVTQCPSNSPVQVSCEENFAPFPGDAYDIRATLENFPEAQQWFQASAAGSVRLTLAPGATCAQIAADGAPAGAFSAGVPAATIDKQFFGQHAFAQGPIPLAVQTSNGGPPPIADLDLELSTSLFESGTATLHLSGNAPLCGPTSLAVQLTDSSSSTELKPLCLDVAAPVISQYNMNNYVIHACAISVN